MNYIREYLSEIEAGNIITGTKVRKVYSDLLSDIDQGKYLFSEKKALKAVEFIQTFCKQSKGEWSGKELTLMLYQKAFISAVFGVLDPVTNFRRFKEVLLLVARKNGKSVLASGIAAYMMIADGEPGAEIYSVATKKDQAKIVFDETHNMIKQSPLLAKYIRKRQSDLYCDVFMSKFQPLSKDTKTMDGVNAHLVIIDELHAIMERNTYEVMKQSQSARRQPLLLMITTAGFQRESIYDDIYRYADGVLNGDIDDPHFLPVMYELDQKKEWTDPACWIKPNPSLGQLKKLDAIISEVQRAKDDPSALNGILVKDFNVKETTSDAWLSYEDLNNEETFDPAILKGSYFIGGADLSKTTDLTCATALVLARDGKRYVLQMYFIPEDGLQKKIKDDHVPYDLWIKGGWVRACKGNMIQLSDITAWFREIIKEYHISPAYIYYDPYAASYWVDEMESNGFRMEKCIQGVKTLSVPMQTLGCDLAAKKINYNNNPVLKWCMGNTGVKTDVNGNIQPVKVSSSKKRIDGLASLLDAYVGMVKRLKEMEGLARDIVNPSADPSEKPDPLENDGGIE